MSVRRRHRQAAKLWAERGDDDRSAHHDEAADLDREMARLEREAAIKHSR